MYTISMLDHEKPRALILYLISYKFQKGEFYLISHWMILRRITVTLSQISTNVFRLTQAKFSSSKIEREKKKQVEPQFFSPDQW